MLHDGIGTKLDVRDEGDPAAIGADTRVPMRIRGSGEARLRRAVEALHPELRGTIDARLLWGRNVAAIVRLEAHVRDVTAVETRGARRLRDGTVRRARHRLHLAERVIFQLGRVGSGGRIRVCPNGKAMIARGGTRRIFLELRRLSA